jgi:Arc/MetJ family transcription regulator
MRTNIVIDDRLMADAVAMSGGQTKRAVVEEALRQFVRLKKQAEILKLRGIGWEGDLEAMRLD